jgi:hypothetical protein
MEIPWISREGGGGGGGGWQISKSSVKIIYLFREDRDKGR